MNVYDWIALVSAITGFILSIVFASNVHNRHKTAEDKPIKRIPAIDELIKDAKFVVNGYAFLPENNKIRIVNLNNIESITILTDFGEVWMTNMENDEILKIQEYWNRNKEFLND